MTARALAELTPDLASAPADVWVSDVTLDSRAVTPGSLFLACRGIAHHGVQFAQQAAERGARAVLFETGAGVQAPQLPPQVFVAAVPRLSARASEIAGRFFGSPSQTMTVAGITGTNGKTTSAWLLAQALTLCGRPAAYAGTLGFGLPGALQPASHTTADAVSVQRQLDTLRRLGATCVGMEVSSHALHQGRVAAVRFHTAVFTNLTRDHLDYHGTLQAYADSKALLLAWPQLKVRVINVDDPLGAQLAARAAPSRLLVTSRQAQRGEFVRAAAVGLRPNGLDIDVESSFGNARLCVPLAGDFNVDNALTVLAVLLGLDVPLAEAVQALSQSRAPSGRMEIFGGAGTLPLVIVDYAHTPDALAKALAAARRHCRGRLSVVFGCGGDRDAGKRPLMGAIAAELADDITLTDDNPRTEDPARIVADIRAGIPSGRAVHIEHDRARAIQNAVAGAAASDAVLVAGKGHEDYQIHGHERRAFADQAVVREQLKVQACSAR